MANAVRQGGEWIVFNIQFRQIFRIPHAVWQGGGLISENIRFLQMDKMADTVRQGDKPVRQK